MEFTEIRALKINGPAKVSLDLVKHMETQSDALVKFSVTNKGTSLAIRPINKHVAAHEWETFVICVYALFVKNMVI